MRHCACSSSALETFIKAVAGLDLRSSQVTKTFITRRSVTTYGHIHYRQLRPLVSGRHYTAQAAGPYYGDDAPDSSIPALDASSAQSTSTAAAVEVPQADEAFTQERVIEKDRKVSDNSSAPAAKMKQENRLARKVRRMAAGTWQPQTQARLLATKEERATRQLERAEAKAKNKTKRKGEAKDQSKPGTIGSSAAGHLNAAIADDRNGAVQLKADSEPERFEDEDGVVQSDLKEVEDGKPRKNKTLDNEEDSIVQSILREAAEDKKPKAPRISRVDQAASSKKPATAELSGDLEDGNTPQRYERPAWQTQKAALKEKFGGAAWNPRKRLSPDSLNGIRALHESDPMIYTTPVLAQHFRITPDAIRRILKSKWRPKEDEIEDRRKRWERRGEDRRKGIAAQKTRSRNARYIKDIINPLRHPDMY